MTTADLLAAGAAASEALSRIAELQWHEKPDGMGWTRYIVASHLCGALQVYATQLASGTPAYVPVMKQNEVDTKGEEWPELVRSQTALLAAVATGAAPGTRAFHPAGSPDTEGFLAMGCVETLLHCWDIVKDTAIEFSGDDATSCRVLQRLFPWAPTDTPRWQTLLFATGRGALDGHESPGDRWMWHNRPLDEWDGTEPRSDAWVGRG